MRLNGKVALISGALPSLDHVRFEQVVERMLERGLIAEALIDEASHDQLNRADLLSPKIL